MDSGHRMNKEGKIESEVDIPMNHLSLSPVLPRCEEVRVSASSSTTTAGVIIPSLS